MAYDDTVFKQLDRQYDVLIERYDPEAWDETVQTTLGEYGSAEEDTALYEADPERYFRSVADSATGFAICNGERPGGHFLQKEAWEARTAAVDATERAIRRAVNHLSYDN